MLNPSTDRRSFSFTGLSLILAGTLSVVLPLAAMARPVSVSTAQRQPPSVPAAAPKLAGGLSATVYDPSGKAIQNVVIVISNPKKRSIVTTDALGKFKVVGLPPGEYDVEMHATGFAPFRMEGVSVGSGNTVDLILVAVPGAPAAVPTGASGARAPQIRVGGDVQQAKLIDRVVPIYPSQAREKRIEGAVLLEAVIGVDGTPKSLRVLNKDIDPSLARAAVEAVSQWRYAPTEIDGKPVEVATQITTNFSFNTPVAAAPAAGQRGSGSRASTALPSPSPPPPPPPPPPSPPASTPAQPVRVRVGGSVMQANLITRVAPEYPEAAKKSRIKGVVILEAVIGVQGSVESVRVVSGNTVLAVAAMDAVRQWRYTPFLLLNGQPVEAITTVTVSFALD